MGSKLIIKIDDDSKHITLEEGLSISELGQLCVAMSNAIGEKEGKLVLKKISEKSAVYELSATTEEIATRFEVVWNRQESADESDFTEEEKKLSKIVGKIVRPGWHLEVQDSKGNKVARIDSNSREEAKPRYSTTRTLYGQLYTFGITIAKNRDGIIVKDDLGKKHAVSVNSDLFESLKQDLGLAFRSIKIAFRVKGTVDLEGNFSNLTLLSYRIPTHDLLQSLEEFIKVAPDQFSHIENPDEEIRKIRKNGK
jgi:hypothetical protein